MKKFLGTNICLFVIVVCFIFWVLIIPAIVGIILLILKTNYDNELREKYGSYDLLNERYQGLENEYHLKWDNLEAEYKNKEKQTISEYEEKLYEIKEKYHKQERECISHFNQLQEEVAELEKELTIKSYDFSEFDGITSEECKNQLALLKNDEQALIKSDNAVTITGYKSKKEMNNNIKQMLRCFNAECDNALLNITVKNIDSMRSRIQKSFDMLNKIFETDNLKLNKELLEIKLKELTLVYTYNLKKEQEKEEQRAIREQMVEEEKVRREIEKEKAKIEKEEVQFKSEISKLMQYLQKTNNDIEKNLYLDKIKELEEKLKLLEKDKENVLEREQNTRAGFVYVISNIGSFGEDVYKIGMTRRLEPMDRIKELSSASVPFPFDVHAMIFSQDAPELENLLHKTFRKYEVNKVNNRKEFFKVALSEIENIVKENHNATTSFTIMPDAYEYRQSIAI